MREYGEHCEQKHENFQIAKFEEKLKKVFADKRLHNRCQENGAL